MWGIMKKKGALKKAFTGLFCSALCLSPFTNIRVGEISYADEYEYDESFEEYLTQQGFPESYKPYLRQLHAEHPTWIFEAMQTGLSWNMTIKNEMVFRRNLVPNRSTYVSSWKDVENIESFDWVNNDWVLISSPYWVQASKMGVEYIMDPRNFLNDDYIFQFEELTYNRNAHTLKGVKQVLAGTFMDNVLVPGTGDAPANDYITSDTYSITDEYLSGLDPNTTVAEFMDNVSVRDSVSAVDIFFCDANGDRKDDDALICTGDVLWMAFEEIPKEDESGEETESTSQAEEGSHAAVDVGYALQYAPLATAIVYGDLNSDGRVTNLDRTTLKLFIRGDLQLNEYQQIAADLNHSDTVTNLDRTTLKLYIRNDMSISTIYQTAGLTYAQAFFEIAKELNVSPYMMGARVIQEQGEGKSELISGTYPGFEGYYDYFNTNAAGLTREDIIVNGLTYAKQKGWDSPIKALKGGITNLCSTFIWKGQNTLYLQKFDVESDYYGTYWHQYMQNLFAPRSEGAKVGRSYAQMGVLDVPFVFRIPVYIGMPEEPCPHPTVDGNPNYKLKTLSVEGYDIDFDMHRYSYTIELPAGVKELTVNAEAVASTTKVYGAGVIELEPGDDRVIITVTAQNGLNAWYVVNLIRPIEDMTTEAETTTEEETTSEEEITTGEETTTEEEGTSHEETTEAESTAEAGTE